MKQGRNRVTGKRARENRQQNDAPPARKNKEARPDTRVHHGTTGDHHKSPGDRSTWKLRRDVNRSDVNRSKERRPLPAAASKERSAKDSQRSRAVRSDAAGAFHRPGVQPRPAQPRREASASPPKPRADKEIPKGTIVVNGRASSRLRSGNPWAYRSDLISADGVPPGSLAPVVDERGKSIGSALYSSSSQIAVRMIDSGRLDSERLPEIIRERINAAIAYRNRVVEASEGCRLVFSEADMLPGLIVDRYNDVLSMQVLTQAMDQEDIRQTVVRTLAEETSPAGIVERVDPRIRELEQLPVRDSGLIWGDRSSTTFAMNGLRFQFDGLTGQKTGAFLDQRENYIAAARYAYGECLDVFTYQGGFALHMARVSQRVTGVDSSRPALEVAEANLALNADELRARGAEVDWIEANAFDLLRDYADAGRQYDTIVLDPPAFAKSKRALDTAMRGYKELNLRGLKMVRTGGVFVTCSCSQHVSESDFLNMLADAAADAHRTVRIVEKRTQAKDHPVLLSMPETQYLKCVIGIVQ